MKRLSCLALAALLAHSCPLWAENAAPSAPAKSDAPSHLEDSDFAALASALQTQLQEEFSKKSAAECLGSDRIRLALAQWRLLTATGVENVKSVAEKEGKEFLKWLLTTPEALEAYLGSGPLEKEGTARGLEIWRDIFQKDPASKSGLWLRVAAATALAHTVPVKSLADGGDIDALKRYQHFRNSHSSKILFPSFDQAATWELRYVVNSWARDEELGWVTAAVDPKLKSQEKIGGAAYMVEYTLFNAKGASIQDGAKFYEGKPVTLQLMDEKGGVCGAISKFGTASAQAFGIPAMPVGQPGHCAFLWKKDPKTWRTGNDIFGWPGSSQHGGIFIHWGTRASYVLLMEEAHRDAKQFLRSEEARWAAAAVPAKATDLLKLAVTAQLLNFAAWKDAISAGQKDPALVDRILQHFANHPLPMVDLLASIEPKLSLTTTELRIAYLKKVTTAIAGGSREAQQGCGEAAVEEMLTRTIRQFSPALAKALGREKSELPAVPADQQKEAQMLVEAALQSTAGRADLQNATMAKYMDFLTSNPDTLARAIEFFGTQFEQAKTNLDRKPAIALARRLILLAAQAENLPAMEKYSAECKKLLNP